MNTIEIAHLPACGVSNARNMSPFQETVKTLKLIGLLGSDLTCLAEARFYMARSGDGASPVHCSVWVHAQGKFTSGYGKARGYGYHKNSAALDSALDSAHIHLTNKQGARAELAGRGDGDMEDALLAIGRAFGATTLKVF